MRLVVGLGSNLGDRLASLRSAVASIAGAHEVLARSRVYETDPVGGPPQPNYLNAAVLVRSTLEAAPFMEHLLAIETSMGRVRKELNGPRTIDLDMLWIDGVTIATDTLRVPHPRLVERAFALGPLLEVAPDASDPRTKHPYSALRFDRNTLRDVGQL